MAVNQLVAYPIISDAIIFASLLGLLSVGLTLTYLTTKVPNFAHASFATVGAYAALTAARVWDTTPYVSIPIAFAVSSLTAVLLYRFILKPLIRKGASPAIQMISTLAFDFVVIAMLNITADYIVRTYQVVSREFTLRSYDAEFFGMPLIILVAPAALASLIIGLHVLLQKTRFGIAMRATIQNPDLAGTVGINVGMVYGVSWILAGGLAGVAGSLMAMWFQGDPYLGTLLLPSIFAASIAGGFTSIYGAIAGGLLVGLAEVLGTRILAGELGSWVIAFRPLIPLIFIVITLLLAPRGLAGIDWSRLRRVDSRG